MYQEGVGCEPDLEMAIKLCTVAHDKGNTHARSKLEDMYRVRNLERVIGVFIRPQRAFDLFIAFFDLVRLLVMLYAGRLKAILVNT